ncbi:nitrate reductase molybdenum cofactor assembly chaperone [Neobacillus muris]|uniref:nitrate reductase molybdenum cofactor assembly chaperone n=1 Tax=Neobacillus muris TaxID=2941334 RepID=UPI0020413E5D|nr:nitrate reductase molybdenum cofactor assembly chaperone [Neobacillus muris]
MINENHNLLFQYCSILLNYPDQEYQEILEEAAEASSGQPESEANQELQQFLAKARSLSPTELVATYVNTFDFGKKTNLYVSYMTNGEQRERGMDLLFLKNYYQMHGFQVTDKELPDYLPVMLEFAGQVDQETFRPILERYYDHMKEIADHLDPSHNLYGHLFQAILLALKGAGITKPVRRSEEICSNSFYGSFSPTSS